jgi:hypothetical protein
LLVLPAPLHRLTPLRTEPATGWLSSAAKFSAEVATWWAWILFALVLLGAWVMVAVVVAPASDKAILLGAVASFLLAGVLGIPVRRGIMKLKSAAIVKRAKVAAQDLGAELDDLNALAAEPDGRIVSVVGWVRGHGYLYHPVDGKPAVGLTLKFQDVHPFVLETMHNFDLLGEAGDAALVVTEGGRMLGTPNVRLNRASHEDRNLISGLDVPSNATPTDWNAYVVRDGDPILVIGTKTTVHDISQPGRPTARPAIASTKERPVLILPLAADRMDVAPIVTASASATAEPS